MMPGWQCPFPPSGYFLRGDLYVNFQNYDNPASLMEKLSALKHLSSQELPNIDLYMDQVTTFMNTHLGASKRHPEDKILTKTMINNYAKNNLLPSPDRKRYSRDHLLLLIFIYYFKNILSINDIEKLLRPIKNQYFKGDEHHDIAYVYDEIFSLEADSQKRLTDDICDYVEMAEALFPDADKEDQEALQEFALICLLSYDVYCKKKIIENILDSREGPQT